MRRPGAASHGSRHGAGGKPSVLVTGASGFIGRRLVARLAAEGWPARCALRQGSVWPAGQADAASVRLPGLEDGPDWGQALEGIETVVHLAAALPGDPGWRHDPIRLRRVNVEGTLGLALSAQRAGVRRLVFLSTVGVHGAVSPPRGFSESDEPRPHDEYSRSKLEAEEALRALARQSSLQAVILRAPMVYGPGDRRHFATLLRVVDAGVPLPFAAVRNARSLLFVDNAVDALVTAARHPDAAGRVFMVSDGTIVSTPDLVRLIGRTLGRKARLFPVPKPALRALGALAGKRRQVSSLVEPLIVDDTLIRSTLSWVPPFSLEEGVHATAGWFRSGCP